MKKIRSSKLYEYLLFKGVLGAPDEIIANTKKEYRKEYKRSWKKARLKQKPELRPNFTKSELATITKVATVYGLTNTDYIRRSALAHASKTNLITQKDKLLTILQKVSMAGILVNNKGYSFSQFPELQEADALLKESESLLMAYLGYDS
jgi:hypothetical protein